MAGKIITIKCPQCGSTEHDELRKNFYRCKSCSTQYVFDGDDSNNQSFDNTKTPDVDDILSRFNVSSDPKFNRKAFIVGAITILVVLSIIIVAIMAAVGAFGSVSNKSTENKIIPSSQSAVIKPVKAYSVSGSALYALASETEKKPLILRLENRFYKEEENSKNGIYYVFIDPKSKEVIKDGKVSNATKGSSKIEFNSFSNNKSYVIIDDDQLYEINTEKLTLTEESKRISNSIPELNSGFATITFLPHGNGDGYRIFTNDGKYFYYFPIINKLYSDEAYKVARDAYSSADKFYIDDYFYAFGKNSSKGDEKFELLKIDYKKYLGGPEELELSPYKLKGDNQYLAHSRSYKRNISVKIIAQDRMFFEPKVIYFDDENIIIIFKPSANPKATFSIQKIDPKTEEVKWTLPNQEEISGFITIQIKNGFMFKTKYDTYIGMSFEGKELFRYKQDD